jgi:hypothetical protein
MQHLSDDQCAKILDLNPAKLSKLDIATRRARAIEPTQ